MHRKRPKVPKSRLKAELQTLGAQKVGVGLRPATPTIIGSEHEALLLNHFLALLAIGPYFLIKDFY